MSFIRLVRVGGIGLGGGSRPGSGENPSLVLVCSSAARRLGWRSGGWPEPLLSTYPGMANGLLLDGRLFVRFIISFSIRACPSWCGRGDSVAKVVFEALPHGCGGLIAVGLLLGCGGFIVARVGVPKGIRLELPGSSVVLRGVRSGGGWGGWAGRVGVLKSGSGIGLPCFPRALLDRIILLMGACPFGPFIRSGVCLVIRPFWVALRGVHSGWWVGRAGGSV